MPTDYSKGKIYKITSPNTDLVYIGSTCAPLLSQRLRGHATDYRRWKEDNRHFVASFVILDAGDHAIELLELCPCTCSDELRAREQHWIQEHGERVCNRRKALLTDEDKREKNREYHQANRDRINEKKREYHQANRDRIIEYHREYHQANRDTLNEYHREYHQANRDRIKERKGELIICACGTRHIKGSKAKHLRSKKHQDYLRQQPQVNEVVA